MTGTCGVPWGSHRRNASGRTRSSAKTSRTPAPEVADSLLLRFRFMNQERGTESLATVTCLVVVLAARGTALSAIRHTPHATRIGTYGGVGCGCRAECDSCTSRAAACACVAAAIEQCFARSKSGALVLTVHSSSAGEGNACYHHNHT